MACSTRVFISSNPYPPTLDAPRIEPWRTRGWPCRWIGCAPAVVPPFVAGYRLRFEVTETATVRVHVTADERYEWFLDGERLGRGSGERGDARHWSYETFDLELTPGPHFLAARVWALGGLAPLAQMSAQPGFLCAPDDPAWIERLGTGAAPWEAVRLGGCEFLTPPPTMTGVGACFLVDGARYPWGWERGEDDGAAGWQPAPALATAADGSDGGAAVPIHRLQPATLPPMREARWPRGAVRFVGEYGPSLIQPTTGPAQGFDPARLDPSAHLAREPTEWQNLLSGAGTVTLAAGTARRVVIDLEDYCCAYPEITTSGGRGGRVRVHWAEALYTDASMVHKGPRGEWADRFFGGAGDAFLPDGGARRVFGTLWWRCGRYVEIVVQAADEPLTLDGFQLLETRYPLEMENTFAASDARLADLAPVLLRGLQMCAHETYLDCPYYEQLQYVGDGVLQALTAAQLTRDDRLWRRFLRLVNASRQADGFSESRYPSREGQSIPTFSLAWVGSLHDYAWWRGDADFVRSLLPGARATLDLWLTRRDAAGAVISPPGWNFMDWIPGPPFWYWGVPPGGQPGEVSGAVNWHLIWTLRRVAEIEDWVGETELAARWRRLAAELTAAVSGIFWNEERGCFADDPAHGEYSDHTQCLATLSGMLTAERRERVFAALLRADPGAMRTSVYFAHYWFEACRAMGRVDAALSRLEQWFELRALGFCTTPEVSDLVTTRSDCHAWSATPLYLYFASVLGVRPAAFGYREVEIAPQLGALEWARGTAIHPSGEIAVDLRRAGADGLRATVRLPDGLTGSFLHGGRRFALEGGTQEIICPA